MEKGSQRTIEITKRAAEKECSTQRSDKLKEAMHCLNQYSDQAPETTSDNTVLGMLSTRRPEMQEKDGYMIVNKGIESEKFSASIKQPLERTASMRDVEFSPTHRYLEARHKFVEPIEGGGLSSKQPTGMTRSARLRRAGSDLHMMQLPKYGSYSRGSYSKLASIPQTKTLEAKCPSGKFLLPSAEKKSELDESAIQVFQKWMKTSPDIAVAVAAIQALTHVVQHCKADTMMGLQVEVVAAANTLTEQNRASISLLAACNLFNRYVTQMWNELQDFEECKKMVIQRGKFFAAKALNARAKIANSTLKILLDGKTVLTHSISRVVIECLKIAAERGKVFKLIVTETRPGGSGILTAEAVAGFKIPVSVVLDSAVASVMRKVDFVLVGAEGVVESGGIINKIGTYSIALIAKACNVPFYVAAESYKFTRMFPLTQEDIPVPADTPCWKPIVSFDYDQQEIEIVNRPRDYTPPEYIDLLFSDLGILTPSAVSDELIKLHR